MSMSESILCAKCGHTVANNIELPTTPVPDLLGGSHFVSESQARMIYDTISSARADISQLDSEITRLDAVLDGLTRKRDALQIYAYSHMALVAPIKRLPPELLSKIFHHYNYGNNESYSRLDLNTVPLLLSSVCSKWRTIALSTPWLWASFTLTIQQKYLESDAKLANTWLARAGTCPLTIRLASRGSYQYTMKQLMKMFLLHCEQWTDLCLSVPLLALDSWAPAKNRLPRLQKLYLTHELKRTLDIFEFAPRLRWLRLAACVDPSMVKVPWNQIEYLDVGMRHVDQCLDLLRKTPNLEKCILVIHDGPGSHHSHSSIQLLRLRSMIFRGDPTHFLDTLLLPRLHEITSP